MEARAEEGGKKPHAGKEVTGGPGGAPSCSHRPPTRSPQTTGRGPLTRRCTFGSMESSFPGRYGQGVQSFSLLLKKEEDVIRADLRDGRLPGGHSLSYPSPGDRQAPYPWCPSHLTSPGPSLRGMEGRIFKPALGPEERKLVFTLKSGISVA